MLASPLLPALCAGAGVFVVLRITGLVGSEALVAGLVVCAGIAFWDALIRGKPRVAPPSEESVPPDLDPDYVGGRIPTPILLLASDGTVRYANEPATSLFGNSVSGGHISNAIRNPAFSEALNAARRSGVWREIEFPMGQEPERHFKAWIRASRQPVAGSGADIGDLLVCLDERTGIHRSQELHRDFVANASHELRTPLATVAGCLETLRGHARDDPEATRRFTSVMQRETDRMRRIVSDLLSLNSIEMQEHVRPTERVDAVSIAQEALSAHVPSAARGITILAPEQPLIMLGARVELLHALDNILANAENHAGGVSGVAVRRAGTKVEIVVRDQGPGVAKEHLPRLTERFYRVNVADSRSRGGTGLGLAIVKHVVVRHQGELGIESEPGVGSQITLRFDLAEEDIPPA